MASNSCFEGNKDTLTDGSNSLPSLPSLASSLPHINNNTSNNSEITPRPQPTVKPKRKRDSNLRKAPQAPKRFKSSYILFFIAQQNVIKSELGPKASVGEVSKRSSEKWKQLSREDKSIWEEKAKIDKERYNAEKERYTGPWQVPWKRAKKDPNAPKRPMSAFLYYSQVKRSHIKQQNPGLKNTEISRVLGKMWQSASQEERSPHILREREEREKYKIRMAQWRKDEARRKEEEMKKQEEQVQQMQSMRGRGPCTAVSYSGGTFDDIRTDHIHPLPYHPHSTAPPPITQPPPPPSQENYFRGNGYDANYHNHHQQHQQHQHQHHEYYSHYGNHFEGYAHPPPPPPAMPTQIHGAYGHESHYQYNEHDGKSYYENDAKYPPPQSTQPSLQQPPTQSTSSSSSSSLRGGLKEEEQARTNSTYSSIATPSIQSQQHQQQQHHHEHHHHPPESQPPALPHTQTQTHPYEHRPSLFSATPPSHEGDDEFSSSCYTW